jgi:hypothetical protein
VKRRRGILLEDVNLAARRRAIYSRKRTGKRRRRGGKRQDGFHFPPTRAPMRQLAASLQSCCRLQRHYSARETRRVETTKRWVVADSGPRGESRAQPCPCSPLWTGFGSDAPDENMHRAGWKKRMRGAIGRDFLPRRPIKPFEGPLGGVGASGDVIRLRRIHNF